MQAIYHSYSKLQYIYMDDIGMKHNHGNRQHHWCPGLTMKPPIDSWLCPRLVAMKLNLYQVSRVAHGHIVAWVERPVTAVLSGVCSEWY